MAPGPPTSLPRGNPLGGAWGEPGPSWLAAPELLLRVQPARAGPARGPMCSAAARALPGGARGRRAAVTSGRLALRAAGGGEARAARPAACVLGPARGPPAPAARRPPRWPLRWLPRQHGPPRAACRRGGPGPHLGPGGRGGGRAPHRTGSPPASATPRDALSPSPRSPPPQPRSLRASPPPASWRPGASPLARCGRRVR